tara:strand:+ start:276 stop:518 length:243 start_codon:yes stop_codon:yes gene_type:complete
MATKKQTAQDAYTQHRKDITSLLLWLELELEKHRINAKGQPDNWCFPGDLQLTRNQLIEALASISHSEQHEIQALLSESR